MSGEKGQAVELYDEYDFINLNVARCPRCGKQLLLVDEEDDIVFCSSDKGCRWSGKECEMDYV